ncbi:MAG: phosphatase PAP2 family protein [Gammaproteobacteria bacterium]|nr:phosphatase PAP2 family protein [Gammaproteobacteria bacterium]MCP5425437.1 phosphatase PAP2 family protein [Gammaproteobacteria bacterium]MCP5459786.1 phosphatase PAP2 family protein [Gammaproteobacteria bacterium]
MSKSLIASTHWQWLADRELNWCLRLNRASERLIVERLFASVSRLGDGVFWYTLMLTLPLILGAEALPVVGHMVVTGALCLLLYKGLKSKTIRPRPCDCNRSIRTTVPPLDQYSFPSGHTLHAVGFSVIVVFYYPQLSWLVIPFTLLVALSRLVLGLHFPSDVLAGATLGGSIASLVLLF